MLCNGMGYNVILDVASYVHILYWNINVNDNLSDAYRYTCLPPSLDSEVMITRRLTVSEIKSLLILKTV